MGAWPGVGAESFVALCAFHRPMVSSIAGAFYCGRAAPQPPTGPLLGPGENSEAQQSLGRWRVSTVAKAGGLGGLRHGFGYRRGSCRTVLPSAPRCDALPTAPLNL